MTNVAYAAGLLDGDGHLHVKRRHRLNNRRAYWICVSISNTHRPVLEWLRERFGGFIQAQQKKLGCKQCYEWRAQSTTGIRFLEATLPFLIIKRRQAEVLIDFHESHRMGRFKTEDERQVYYLDRETRKASLMALTKRGV